jgi:enoyl-CoA hydratase/carnithine racemase
VGKLLEATVAPGSLARVALLGRNFAGDEALSIGLVDELAEDDSFESVCLERLEEFAEKDRFAFGVTKRYLRAATLDLMRQRESALTGDFLDGWFSEGTQQRIRDTIASLRSS